MFTTIFVAVLIVIALLLALVKIKIDDKVTDVRNPDGYGVKQVKTPVYLSKGFALIPAAIAALILVFACTTIVQAKQVGVVTTFGKPGDTTLTSGLHVKAPWQKVTEIDATIQTDEYHGDRAIKVVLADKNTADISATVRWSVNTENANDVYADFRSDDPTKSLRDAVVSTQFKAAVNGVFGSFDATAEAEADYDGLAKRVTDLMLSKTRGLVDIESVTVSYIKPSDKLQAKIEAIQAQEAKTRIADEAKNTATKEAEANRILSDSISNDPNVLVSKCLDLLSEGYQAPAGFTCWPGSNGAVVVPSSK